MSVLLLNPRVNPASQNKVINKIINTFLPSSLGVLAEALIKSGISSVRLIDEQIDFIEPSDLKESILSLEPPRIIGLSVLTVNSKRAYELSELIKKIDTKALVVLGGIHPTVLPDEALSHAGVDVVVRGEGERTFEELVHLVINEKDYTRIQGVSFRENGKIIHNHSRPMIDNLDEIPPFPYYLFEKNKNRYFPFGSIFTSRGCPYDCIFCSSRSISGKKYRHFSIERVISEITTLADKYGQRIIFMVDDNIGADHKHFLDLLSAIIEKGLHKRVCFQGSMRGDNLSEEILDKAKAANFKMISFGLETGSESLMEIINKGETVKEVVEAIRNTDKKGIAAATTVIFGLPTETRKDRWDTMKLVRSLPLSSVRFNTLTPYPGTPVYEKLKREEKLSIRNDWENFAVQYMWEGDDLPYLPENTNRYELMFDTMFANLSFYLSFNGIKRMLKSSFAGGNVITLRDRWYLSLKTMYRLFSVFLYLTRRFVLVTYKMLLKIK